MASTIPDLIALKRDGRELSPQQVQTFIQGVVDGSAAECQIGAMLMAMYLNGLSPQEVSTLTLEMKNSGTSLDWPKEWQGQLVDKHSTGGVGDKISLVLAPALAACGVKVPMISGRGLGHTGGTLDKLEAIPGYNVSLTPEKMTSLLNFPGCFIAGQTGNVCPADKKLYATRDVTSTVNHNGLIIGSIVSKKAAENINTLVLDVKTGSGAFLSDREDATSLAKAMTQCSKDLGINTTALLTEMNSPIGNMVGNALEVAESIWCLQGHGSADVTDLAVELGGHALYANGSVTSVEEGKSKVKDAISSGSALSVFKNMIQGHGVSVTDAEDLCDPTKDVWDVLPVANHKTELTCTKEGFVKSINSFSVAKAGHQLGGGRNAPGEAINMAVGLELMVDIGTPVKQGQTWVRVHHHDPTIPETVMAFLENAVEVSDTEVAQRTTRVLEVFQ